MDGSVAFTRWRQCESPSNTCLLGPTRVHNPIGISIGSVAFCTAHCRLPIFYSGRYLCPSKLLLCIVDLDRIYTWFLGPIRVHSPNAISIVSAVFAHAAHDRESLNFTVGRPFLLKVGLSPGGSGLRLIQTWIRDPPEYTTQTASGSVQPFLQG